MTEREQMEKAIRLAAKFFNETMKNVNIAQSWLSADDIATWNHASIEVNRALPICRTEVAADGG